METETKTKRKKLTPAERLARYGERYLKLSDQGKRKFEKRRELLTKMISAGLMVDQPIIVNGDNFVLVDNFDGDRTGGWATVNRFDLKPAPKNPRKKSDIVAAAAVAD
jgi:hypothetical protein